MRHGGSEGYLEHGGFCVILLGVYQQVCSDQFGCFIYLLVNSSIKFVILLSYLLLSYFRLPQFSERQLARIIAAAT
jgi:hypothetical protein